jgi:hypothetical protein
VPTLQSGVLGQGLPIPAVLDSPHDYDHCISFPSRGRLCHRPASTRPPKPLRSGVAVLVMVVVAVVAAGDVGAVPEGGYDELKRSQTDSGTHHNFTRIINSG